MKQLFSIIVTAIGVSLIAACKTDSDYRSGLEQFDLDMDQVATLRPKAESGNRRAARKLMLYYGLVVHDQTEVEHWRSIAEAR